MPDKILFINLLFINYLLNSEYLENMCFIFKNFLLSILSKNSRIKKNVLSSKQMGVMVLLIINTKTTHKNISRSLNTD